MNYGSYALYAMLAILMLCCNVCDLSELRYENLAWYVRSSFSPCESLALGTGPGTLSWGAMGAYSGRCLGVSGTVVGLPSKEEKN